MSAGQSGSLEPLAQRREVLVPFRRQLAEGRRPGRRRDGVAVERSAVAQRVGPAGVEAVHDLGPAAECRGA